MRFSNASNISDLFYVMGWRVTAAKIGVLLLGLALGAWFFVGGEWVEHRMTILRDARDELETAYNSRATDHNWTSPAELKLRRMPTWSAELARSAMCESLGKDAPEFHACRWQYWFDALRNFGLMLLWIESSVVPVAVAITVREHLMDRWARIARALAKTDQWDDAHSIARNAVYSRQRRLRAAVVLDPILPFPLAQLVLDYVT